MPCCIATEESVTSRKIDRQIAITKRQYKRTFRILLLGTGDSGKSTLLKQMRYIHGDIFEPHELAEFRTHIYNNIVRGMKVLLDARQHLNLQWQYEENANLVDTVLNTGDTPSESVFSNVWRSIAQLWTDGAIQKAVSLSGTMFHLTETVPYFMSRIHEVAKRDYVPTNDDVLRARKPTKNIIEYTVSLEKAFLTFVDVGGQRQQRRTKWGKLFAGNPDNPNELAAILFIVASSEYDQVLAETRPNEEPVNRMVEALSVFNYIVNHTTFQNIPIIVFFNKVDLLEQKVARGSNIGRFFPDFTGDPRSLKDVEAFIEKSFFKQRTRPCETPFSYKHFTTAIDTTNIKKVFKDVRDIILQQNIKMLMLN